MAGNAVRVNAKYGPSRIPLCVQTSLLLLSSVCLHVCLSETRLFMADLSLNLRILNMGLINTHLKIQ